jgi:hypothetical protein
MQAFLLSPLPPLPTLTLSHLEFLVDESDSRLSSWGWGGQGEPLHEPDIGQPSTQSNLLQLQGTQLLLFSLNYPLLEASDLDVLLFRAIAFPQITPIIWISGDFFSRASIPPDFHLACGLRFWGMFCSMVLWYHNGKQDRSLDQESIMSLEDQVYFNSLSS